MSWRTKLGMHAVKGNRKRKGKTGKKQLFF
jgi:hypothetical protein